MQSLGDGTLADLMRSDITLKDLDIPCARSPKKLGPVTRSKRCAGRKNESDLAKYFNDSLVFVSGDANGSKENVPPANFESEVVPGSLMIESITDKTEVTSEKFSSRNERSVLPTVDRRDSKNPANDEKSSTKKKKYSPVKEPLGRIDEATLSFLNVSKNIRPSENSIMNENQETTNNRYPKTLRSSHENSANRSKDQSSRLTTDSHIDIPASSSQPDSRKLSNWGLPLTILRKYEARGVIGMFPWQVECLSNRNLLENNRNLIYSAPTSAGKTLVAEILMIKTVLERRKKVIFILPFVSVVQEKMYYFQDLLSDSGVRVEGFMGGCAPAGGFAATDVAIATMEKANSLINQLMEAGNLVNLGAVIIDELHLLGDSHRGYLLELLLTKLKYMTVRDDNVRVQLIGMSATLPNLEILAEWLDAELYKTNFRPVPLNEYCKIGKTIYDEDMKILRNLSKVDELNGDADDIVQLCIETIFDGRSVLIFCPTKIWCENLATQIAQMFCKIGRENTVMGRNLRSQLNTEAITEMLEQLKRCPVGLDDLLKNVVSFGTGFHHAGLTMDEREVVEGGFRGGALRVLTATSTLSSGVNLPARRVIIRSIMFHGKPIDTLTYKQMTGRAGRMGKDTSGESFIVCKPNEKKLASALLRARLKPIESCLEGAEPLIRAILEAVASEVAYTADDVQVYVKCTLLSRTSRRELEKSVAEAIEYLVFNELLMSQKSVTGGDDRWIATQLGKACLAASIAPHDALFVFDELQKARRCIVLDTELHVVYLVTPLNSSKQIGHIDWIVFFDLWKNMSESERRVGRLIGVDENFIVAAIRGATKIGKILDLHKRFYTALALHELVRERSLTEVCRKYGCCRGVIQGLQQSAAMFAGMMAKFCNKLGWTCMELLIEQFQGRLQFGVCRELLDLLRLPMLNGLRARSLYRDGITTVAELAVADELNVERALHNALPFESEKERHGEHETAAVKRNKMRCVFVTGRDGLTPREAAVILVREARNLVKNSLGLDDLQWNQRETITKIDDRSATNCEISDENFDPSRSDVCRSMTDFSVKIHRITNEPGDNDGTRDNTRDSENTLKGIKFNDQISKIDEIIVEPNFRNGEIRPTICEKSESNLNVCETVEIDDKIDRVNDNEEIFDFTGEIDLVPKKIVEKVVKTVEKSPENLLTGDSVVKASESRSPSLFGDSLNLDTQECNVLEQNVIDSLNMSIFGDTNFSESAESRKNTSTRRRSSGSAITKIRSSVERKTINKNTSSRRSSKKLDEKNTSDKSIVWDDDSWNDTNGVIETIDRTNNVNSRTKSDDFLRKKFTEKSNSMNDDKNDKYVKIPTPPMLKNVCTDRSSDKSRLLDLRKISQKRRFEESKLEQSPIASVRTFSLVRRSSTNSNKSDNDDVIIPSQSFEPSNATSTTKNRTRMKLESLRRTQKRSTTPATVGNRRNDETRGLKNLDTQFFRLESVVDGNDDEAADKSAKNSCKKSSLFARNDDKVSLLRKRPMEIETIVEDASRSKKMQLKKIDDPRIANVTIDKTEFNNFKVELIGRTDISMALDCKSFLDNTASIGTKIIGVTGIDGRKRSRKIDNCVHGNKKLCGVAITWDGLVVYYISFDNGQDTKVPIKDRLNLLTEILGNRDVTVRCFSLKETYKMLYNCCRIASSCNFYDPKIADWLLDQSDQSERSFDQLINEHLSEGKFLLHRIGCNIGNGGPGSNVNSAVHSDSRATTEAALTWHLMNRLIKKLEKRSPTLLQTFKEVEMRTVAILARMELTGIGVNLKSLQELSDVIQREMMQLEEKAYSLAGKKFNFSSSKSVAQVLGLYNGKKVSTNKAALGNCDNPISSLVIYWRKLSTTQIKIVFPLLRLAECNSRIHGNCLTNTSTGRISMHEPNLQNVPRDFDSHDGSFVISVRMAFVPIIGNVVISADYCQLELRILAHFSKEPNLCKILRKEGDVFKNIAARWYNVDEEKIDDKMRHTTKQLCYGMIYGMGVKTLAETLSVTEDEAKEFLETFMSAYPGIRPWLGKVVDEARAVGYVKTLMHRRRFFPALDSQVPSERGQAERQAVNTKVQGSAADIAKKAMVLIDETMRREFIDYPLVIADAPIKRKLRSRSREPLPRGGFLVLQIHDELLYEVNASDLHQVAKIIRNSMENCCSLRVPLPVKLKIGPTWGDLEEYKLPS